MGQVAKGDPGWQRVIDHNEYFEDVKLPHGWSHRGGCRKRHHPSTEWAIHCKLGIRVVSCKGCSRTTEGEQAAKKAGIPSKWKKPSRGYPCGSVDGKVYAVPLECGDEAFTRAWNTDDFLYCYRCAEWKLSVAKNRSEAREVRGSKPFRDEWSDKADKAREMKYQRGVRTRSAEKKKRHATKKG